MQMPQGIPPAEIVEALSAAGFVHTGQHHWTKISGGGYLDLIPPRYNEGWKYMAVVHGDMAELLRVLRALGGGEGG